MHVSALQAVDDKSEYTNIEVGAEIERPGNGGIDTEVELDFLLRMKKAASQRPAKDHRAINVRGQIDLDISCIAGCRTLLRTVEGVAVESIRFGEVEWLRRGRVSTIPACQMEAA